MKQKAMLHTSSMNTGHLHDNSKSGGSFQQLLTRRCKRESNRMLMGAVQQNAVCR